MKEKRTYTGAQKRAASLHLLTFEELFRSISSNVIAGNIVVLLAVQFHAGNMALSLISSSYFVAGFAVPLLLQVFNRHALVKSLSWTWLLSGLVCLAYLPLLFMGSSSLAVPLILGTCILCQIFRVTGSPLWEYLLKLMAGTNSAGKVIGKVSNTYQAGTIISQLALFVLLGFSFLKSVPGLVLLVMCGIVIQVAAFIVSVRVPYTEKVSYEPQDHCVKALKEAVHRPEVWKYMVLRWAFLQVTVVLGLIVPFMKVFLGTSDSLIFLYTAALSTSYLVAGNITKYLADRWGSKPLLKLAICTLLVTTTVLLCYNPSYGLVLFFCVAVLSMFLSQLCNMLIQRLYTKAIPDTRMLPYNTLFYFIMGVMSLTSGILGGVFADLGGNLGGSGFILNTYSFVFLFALAIEIACAVLVFSIREKGSISSSKAARMIFSINDLQTIKKVDELSDLNANDAVKRKKILMAIGYNQTQIAKDTMHDILASSFSFDTYEILRSLGEKPNMDMANDVVALAKDDDSFVQLEAVNALSSYPKNELVRSTLVALLDDRWASVRSMAARSLGIITGPDEQLLKKINSMSVSAYHIDEVINYLIAKRFLDPQGEFFSHIFEHRDLVRSATYNKTRYTVVVFLWGAEFATLVKLYNAMGNADDLRDIFMSNFTSLHSYPWFNEESFAAAMSDLSLLAPIVSLAVASLAAQGSHDTIHLKEALDGFVARDISYASGVDLLTALFITLTMLKGQNQ